MMDKKIIPALVVPPGLTAQFSETEAQNRQAVVAALKSIQAGDVEPFWALFDPDVEFHEAQCLPYGGVHKGADTARRVHASIRDHFELFPELQQVLAGGDLVIAHIAVTMRAHKTGKSAAFPVNEIYRFRGGKIVEWRVLYFDTHLAVSLLQ
jgi:ketosteroid isomerase-like protein